MAIPNMSEEQMRSALKELEQATFNHEQWSEMLYGTLICRLPADERDVSPDAHRMCRFGQWYYKSGSGSLERHPGFAEIGLAHERMHQYAGSLLRSSMEGAPISIADYERFVSALKRLRLEIATVQRELDYALSSLDPLTGTSNRSGMLSKLREEHSLVKRNVHACTVAMVDLDRFKLVNDTYGHGAGDRVLVGFARYLIDHLRPYDRIFRYGGEEFLICLPGTDLQSGRTLLDRLREELQSLPQETDGRGTFHVTISTGMTSLDSDVAVEQSIDRADKALYVAKASGRNKVVVWDQSMSDVPAATDAAAER